MDRESPPTPEAARLGVLRRIALLDTEPQVLFDEWARTAALVCETPVAAISFVDESRVWFKARLGIDAPETPREGSFCAQVVARREALVVHDTAADTCFANNPFVIGPPFVRFYAGAPLIVEGAAVGTLCVMDNEVRDLKPRQARALEAFARQLAAQIELRRPLPEKQPDVFENPRSIKRKDLLAMLAHDLKSPLSTILGFTDLMRDRRTDEEERAAILDFVDSSVRRALTLTLNLVDAIRLDGHGMVLQREPTRFETLVAHALESSSTAARLQKVEFEIAIDRDVPPLDIDVRMMGRAIGNLVSNAIRFSPEGGHVRVCAFCDGNEAVLGVGDEGATIPAGAFDKVFEPYSLTGFGRDDSSGIGLYIVKAIVEAHGGRVSAQSPGPVGALFELRLPVSRTS